MHKWQAFGTGKVAVYCLHLIWRCCQFHSHDRKLRLFQFLMYFERICKPFERFVERFERIFLGVRPDDEWITKGLPDNHLCPFCLSQICMYHANKSKFWCLTMAGKDANSSLTITKSRKKKSVASFYRRRASGHSGLSPWSFILQKLCKHF